jgi:hypothetical protein
VRTFDPSTKRVGYFRRYPVPVSAGYFSVAPNLASAVLNDGRGLYERLLWLRRKKAVPARLPFTRVGYPSWSRDGRWIAVDAVPSDQDAHGVAREGLHRTSTSSTGPRMFGDCSFATS